MSSATRLRYFVMAHPSRYSYHTPSKLKNQSKTDDWTNIFPMVGDIFFRPLGEHSYGPVENILDFSLVSIATLLML
jgi:hypothetical protein